MDRPKSKLNFKTIIQIIIGALLALTIALGVVRKKQDDPLEQTGALMKIESDQNKELIDYYQKAEQAAENNKAQSNYSNP